MALKTLRTKKEKDDVRKEIGNFIKGKTEQEKLDFQEAFDAGSDYTAHIEWFKEKYITKGEVFVKEKVVVKKKVEVIIEEEVTPDFPDEDPTAINGKIII